MRSTTLQHHAGRRLIARAPRRSAGRLRDADRPGRRPAATRDASDVPPPPVLDRRIGRPGIRGLRARNTVASQPIADEPSAPDGFDWMSAAIGAVAAAGLAIVSFAALGTRRPAARRAARA